MSSWVQGALEKTAGARKAAYERAAAAAAYAGGERDPVRGAVAAAAGPTMVPSGDAQRGLGAPEQFISSFRDALAVQTQPLIAGDRALISGLTSAAGQELNGEIVIVDAFDQMSQRYTVTPIFEGLAKPVNIR